MNRGRMIYNNETDEERKSRLKYQIALPLNLLLIIPCVYLLFTPFFIYFIFFAILAIIFFLLLLVEYISISDFKLYENGLIRPTNIFPIAMDLNSKFISFKDIRRIRTTPAEIHIHLKNDSISFQISALNTSANEFIELIEEHAPHIIIKRS